MAVSLPSPSSFPAGQTQIRRLALTQYRNHAALVLEPDARSVVIHGPNGAGKTNVLEAVSFLSPGRGLRNARLAEVTPATDPAAAWAVHATVADDHGDRSVGTGADPTTLTAPSPRRLIRIDGEAVTTQGALCDVLSLHWITPRMDRIFDDAASSRRRFLDRIVYGYEPSHASNVNRYEALLRRRNRLLADGQMDDRWCAAVEESLAGAAIAVTVARLDIVNRLRTSIAATPSRAPLFPTPLLAVDGHVETVLQSHDALDAEQHLRTQLATTRHTDRQRGSTSIGPHRSDFSVVHMEKNMPAAQCSTGEQKALLIAIILANLPLMTAETGRKPILLLDDLPAHLDVTRMSAVIDDILRLGIQCWFTGTDKTAFADLGEHAVYYSLSS